MAKGLLFSGQGAQRVGMGHSLYVNESIAKEIYERADEILGWKISVLSFEGPEEDLTQTRACQPALFLQGYVIYKLLEERNVIHDEPPSAMMGLSLGEVTALTCAGAFDFETGLKVVAERGRLMQEACEATDGTMASVIGGSLEQVEALCRKHDVDLANLNNPGQIVVSGETMKVKALVDDANRSGNFRMVIQLKVAGAYHSRLMEPARTRFEQFLQGVTLATPSCKVYSNVTGIVVSNPEEIREALVKQVISTVRWEDCMRNAANEGITNFYECGHGGILAGIAKRIDRSWNVTSLSEHGDLPTA